MDAVKRNRFDCKTPDRRQQQQNAKHAEQHRQRVLNPSARYKKRHAPRACCKPTRGKLFVLGVFLLLLSCEIGSFPYELEHYNVSDSEDIFIQNGSFPILGKSPEYCAYDPEIRDPVVDENILEGLNELVDSIMAHELANILELKLRKAGLNELIEHTTIIETISKRRGVIGPIIDEMLALTTMDQLKLYLEKKGLPENLAVAFSTMHVRRLLDIFSKILEDTPDMA